MQLHFLKWDAQEEEIAKVVLLHGMGGTGALWRPVAAGLEKDITVIAPDQRGHGKSRVHSSSTDPCDRPRYTPLDFGQDVVETIRQHQLGPAFFVGHSMGMRTAMAVAHLAPELVSGLVLVDLGFSGPAGGGLGDVLRNFMADLPDSFPSRVDARNYLQARCPDEAIVQYLMAVSVYNDDQTALSFPFDRSALVQTIDSARDTSVSQWVAEALQRNTPILALRGERSTVWSRKDFEAEKARFSTDPLIRFEEFPEAGHGLPFEKRPQFIQALKTFISQSKMGR